MGPCTTCSRRRARARALLPVVVVAAELWPALCGDSEFRTELPLQWGRFGRLGLATAEISVGTPPQAVKVALDSGSPVLWVPGPDTGGFWPDKSTSYRSVKGDVQLPAYADGLEVAGEEGLEVVSFGNRTFLDAPLLVRNASAHMLLPQDRSSSSVSSPNRGPEEGILGISSCLEGRSESEDAKDNGIEGFFCHFWRVAPADMPRTLQLDLGKDMRLVLGAELHTKGTDAVRFLAAPYASETPLWYGSIRALGLEVQSANSFLSPWSSMSIDFNSVLPRGAAGLLDSGASAIRVSSQLFEVIKGILPSSCKPAGGENNPHPSFECSCDSDEDINGFPTISLSFEASGNVRLLGLDFGADHLACIPPSAYVVRDGSRCQVAIVDGGPRHTAFGTEAMVLGVPFFRATPVGFDAVRREASIGPPGESWTCSDPKNWWSTGRRLSGKRIALCLTLVSVLGAYIFLSYSPNPVADQLRMRVSGWAASVGDRVQSARAGNGGDGSARNFPRLSPGRSPAQNAMPDLADHSSFVALTSDTEEHR